MQKYDHLFFDLDHTLWDFDTNARFAMRETVSEFKLDDQIENFELFYDYYEKINANLWEAYRNQKIRKPELIRKRFEDTLSHFSITGIEPLAMNDCYLKWMPLQKTLFPDVIGTLEYLKKRGYQMHVITNGFSIVQHQKIETSGLKTYFNRIFISEEIQIPKPDKRIFQYALKCCNAKKSKSIMIGDSWNTDIIGARNAGINQVYVLNHNNLKDSPPENEWGTDKFYFYEKVSSSNTTFIIEKIGQLTKLL